MAESCSIEKNGVSIHIGLFKSEGILGQERLFALLDIYSYVENHCLLCAPVSVTVRGASAIIGGNLPD